jgi:hypothetical protein
MKMSKEERAVMALVPEALLQSARIKITVGPRMKWETLREIGFDSYEERAFWYHIEERLGISSADLWIPDCETVYESVRSFVAKHNFKLKAK